MNIKSLQQNPYFIKYKLFIIPILSILISIGLLMALIVPQISSGLETQKQVDNTKEKVKILTTKKEVLDKVDDSEYKDYLQTSLVAVSQDKDISGVIGQVLFFVRSNQLIIDNVGFGTSSTDETGIQTFQIRLETQGDIEDVKRFITDIKKAPRLLRMSGISISGNRSSTKVQASLAISTYFQPLPTIIGKIDQPLTVPTAKDLELLTALKENLNTIPVTNSEDVTGPQGKADPFQ